MKFIVKLFPEIMIKSTSVRQRFIKILTSNIRTILKQHFSDIAVVMHWDYIEVKSKISVNDQRVAKMLTLIPGIQHIHVVEDVAFSDLHDIFVQTLAHYHTLIDNKTFCVRVKRRGEHPFTSIDVERYVGGGLNQLVHSAKVKLIQPEVMINLDIKNDRLLLIKNRFDGLGGFPTGTQSDVISLISGGYDSGVSSYMLMRRGCRVHYCFLILAVKPTRSVLNKWPMHYGLAMVVPIRYDSLPSTSPR